MNAAHLQYDLSLSHTNGSHIKFSVPDHINLLLSCVAESLGSPNQTGNTVHVTLLSVPSEMFCLKGEDFHIRDNTGVVCGGIVICSRKGGGVG